MNLKKNFLSGLFLFSFGLTNLFAQQSTVKSTNIDITKLKTLIEKNSLVKGKENSSRISDFNIKGCQLEAIFETIVFLPQTNNTLINAPVPFGTNPNFKNSLYRDLSQTSKITVLVDLKDLDLNSVERFPLQRKINNISSVLEGNEVLAEDMTNFRFRTISNKQNTKTSKNSNVNESNSFEFSVKNKVADQIADGFTQVIKTCQELK